MVAVLRGSSRVTSKGQITIPQGVREECEIRSGDTVYFLMEDDKLVLRGGPIKLGD